MNETSKQQQAAGKRLDAIILIIVSLVILALLVFFIKNVNKQELNHEAAIGAALSSPVDHAALITYLISLDFGIAKSSSILISFIIILIGALYVLRIASYPFHAFAEVEGKFQIILSTASPGLVMVLLGAILVTLSLYKESRVSYKRSPGYAYGEAPEPFVNDRQRIEPQTTEMEAS